MPLPGRAGHERSNLLITVPEPQFVERLSGQECECQNRNADNEQTHHQRVALHSLSPCRMAGKRLTSELLGSFVGLGCVLTPKSWTVKHEAYRSDSDIQLESDLLISG